jgi:hypothetical protein
MPTTTLMQQVKFEAMLLVVALVVALTLLENKPLALDFICVALES